MEDKNFREFLKEQIEARGLTPGRMSEETGISARHIQALLDGETGRLPSAPYVRGYLVKIAQLLDLNPNALWKIYIREFPVPTSGAVDRLPVNRYARKPLSMRWLIVAVLAGIVVIYLASNAGHLLGQPTLEIVSPSSETVATTLDTIVLMAKINPNDKLLIGNEEVVADANGEFRKTYALEPGLNQIEFTVTRFLGKELHITRNVIYQP